MAGIATRNKFSQATTENEEEKYDIFDYILKTDMEFVPKPDVDLTHEKIENNQVIQHWLQKYAEKTQTNYTFHIEQYLLYHNLTPEQAICEAINDDDKNIMKREYIQRINKFYNLLVNMEYEKPMADGTVQRQKYSNNAIIVKLAAVKSFYIKFGVDIPHKALDLHIANSSIPINEDVPEKEEIEYALSQTKSKLMECIIYGQTSSGLAGVDLLNVSLGQYLNGKITVKKAITDENGGEKLVDVELCRLVIQRQKNKWRGVHKFITFFSPECCEKIDSYLESRNKPPRPSHRNKTTIKRAYQKRRYDIDLENGKDPYEIPLFIPNKVSDRFLEDRDESIRKLSTDTMQNMYRELADACGKSNAQYEFGLIRSHNMREFCSQRLENMTNRPTFVRHIMGHKSGNVEKAYYKKHEKPLTDFYIEECLPLLQFTETTAIKLMTDGVIRLEKAEQENEALKAKVEAQDKQQAEMSERLSKLEILAEMRQRSVDSVTEIWDNHIAGTKRDSEAEPISGENLPQLPAKFEIKPDTKESIEQEIKDLEWYNEQYPSPEAEAKLKELRDKLAGMK
ncbi:hypothetical protein V7O61_06565 [Methanolobus sp. WCC1]|uniref:hypothetical protein n=1 Tax=unclassified Methanolobus TaxID=2629569 RepID=UPI00324E4754